jgi:hypothetical protein
MPLTALVLDALITVPFVEIQNGRSYYSFFSSSIFWIFVDINSTTVYCFWRIKIKNKV